MPVSECRHFCASTGAGPVLPAGVATEVGARAFAEFEGWAVLLPMSEDLCHGISGFLRLVPLQGRVYL